MAWTGAHLDIDGVREWVDQERINSFDREQALRYANQCAAEISDIRAQIDKARRHAAATGEYADREWFHRAESARRAKGWLQQRLQARVGELRGADAHQRALHWERAFVEAARSALPADTFGELCRAAHDLARDDQR